LTFFIPPAVFAKISAIFIAVIFRVTIFRRRLSFAATANIFFAPPVPPRRAPRRRYSS
jgi:hypothetical protein